MVGWLAGWVTFEFRWPVYRIPRFDISACLYFLFLIVVNCLSSHVVDAGAYVSRVRQMTSEVDGRSSQYYVATNIYQPPPVRWPKPLDHQEQGDRWAEGDKGDGGIELGSVGGAGRQPAVAAGVDSKSGLSEQQLRCLWHPAKSSSRLHQSISSKSSPKASSSSESSESKSVEFSVTNPMDDSAAAGVAKVAVAISSAEVSLDRFRVDAAAAATAADGYICAARPTTASQPQNRLGFPMALANGSAVCAAVSIAASAAGSGAGWWLGAEEENYYCGRTRSGQVVQVGGLAWLDGWLAGCCVTYTHSIAFAC